MSIQIGGLVCDLDGVVYRGDEAIPGASEALAEIRAMGIRLLFATNNSRHTVEDYVSKLAGFDLDATPDEIVTSAVVLGEVLQDQDVAGLDALVLGGQGLHEAVEGAGANIVTGTHEVGLVAVGWDVDINYERLRDAGIAVRNGALFYASNSDATFPAPDGTLWPGAGAIVAAVETAGGRKATVVGKPNAPMAEVCTRRLDGVENIAVVGDRPDTDLALGTERGWTRILVTTGVIGAEEAREVVSGPRPHRLRTR